MLQTILFHDSKMCVRGCRSVEVGEMWTESLGHAKAGGSAGFLDSCTCSVISNVSRHLVQPRPTYIHQTAR